MNKRKEMTKWEFEQFFHENSGFAIEQMNKQGLEAEPCSCADPHCHGWKMVGDDQRKKVPANFKRAIA